MNPPRQEEALFTAKLLAIPFVAAIAAVLLSLLVDYLRRSCSP